MVLAWRLQVSSCLSVYNGERRRHLQWLIDIVLDNGRGPLTVKVLIGKAGAIATRGGQPGGCTQGGAELPFGQEM